ncbi:MAG: ParB N-terminal domain-containing protein [Candidatus Bathyarchaeia archaeon]
MAKSKEIKESKEEKKKFREVRLIPIDLLVEAPWNPQKMTDREFNALVENIRQVGLIDPLQVVPLPDGRYRVIGGNHRLQALRILEYDHVQCVICEDFDEDISKLQSVRMNVIHGKLDPEKFIRLHDEMVKKYGKEAIDLFMITDEKVLKSLMKDVKEGLPPEIAKKMEEAKKEIKTIDDLGRVLNEIFSKHGDTLKYGFLVFSFGGKEHHYVEMDQKLLKRVKYLEELAVAREEPLTNIFNRVMAEKGVL